MPRFRPAIIAILILVAAAIGFAQESAPQAGTTAASERIGEQLRRPALEIPAVPPQSAGTTPTFHVKVEGDWPLETPLQVIRRELAEEAGHSRRVVPGVGFTPPLVAVDVLPAIMGAIRNVREAYYAHEVENARERVAEDLAAFCAINDCSQIEQSSAEGVITPK